MDNSPEIRLVVFDLGRVLIRICDDWQHACRLASISAPSRSMNASDEAALLRLVHQHEVGRLNLQGFSRDVATLIGLTPQEVCAMSEAFILGPYPGAADLVRELRDAGVPTACLSNTNAHHWELMMGGPASFPVELLTHRFASHLIGARKPDDPIYAHVEAQTGLPARSILFFDDVEENVHSARRRGWQAHQIDPKPDDPIAQMRTVLEEVRILPRLPR